MKPTLQNITNQDFIQSQKDKVQLSKKKVKSTFTKLNPQDQLILKLEKKRPKYQCKFARDLEEIKAIIQNLNDENEILLISNKFDSPNILEAVHQLHKIKSIYISTWAITDIAFLRMQELGQNNIQFHILLDTIHSYKWIYKSGAHEIIKENAHFYFTENHSKFQLYELEDGTFINIIGSFNFTNNPRYENIRINTCPDEFQFYRSFFQIVAEGKNQKQKTLLQ